MAPAAEIVPRICAGPAPVATVVAAAGAHRRQRARRAVARGHRALISRVIASASKRRHPAADMRPRRWRGQGCTGSWGGNPGHHAETAGVCCAARSLPAVCCADTSAAYDPALHQQFTFIAAKQLNRCLEGSSLPRLTPLQVRYIAKSDVAQAQGSWFGAVPLGLLRPVRAEPEEADVADRYASARSLPATRKRNVERAGDGRSVLRPRLRRELSAEHDVAGARGAGVLHALVAFQFVRPVRRLSDRRSGARSSARHRLCGAACSRRINR